MVYICQRLTSGPPSPMGTNTQRRASWFAVWMNCTWNSGPAPLNQWSSFQTPKWFQPWIFGHTPFPSRLQPLPHILGGWASPCLAQELEGSEIRHRRSGSLTGHSFIATSADHFLSHPPCTTVLHRKVFIDFWFLTGRKWITEQPSEWAGPDF